MGHAFKTIWIALIALALVSSGCSSGSGSKGKYTPRAANNGAAPKVTRSGVPAAPSLDDEDQNDDDSAANVPSVPKANTDQYEDDDGTDGDNESSDDQSTDGSADDSVQVASDESLSIDGATLNVLGDSHQCGDAYKNQEPDWMPGTLRPPAQAPILTGGKTPRGFEFTDSHDDSIMKLLANAFKKSVTGCMIDPSLELAKRISYVDVYTDIKDKAEARVTFELYDGSLKNKDKSAKEKIVVHMMATFGGKMTSTREPLRDENGKPIFNLVQTNKAKHGLRFRGYISCVDADMGCQTTIIKIEQLTKENKVCRTAYAVHRHGNAHITIHPDDREYGRTHDNQSYAELANLLGNTADANCIVNLRRIDKSLLMPNEMEKPNCAVERMRQQCGGLPLRTPYAEKVGLKTWSVLYGAAKFKFFVDKTLYVEGPLVYSKIRPVIESQALNVSGSGVKKAYLVNNDGAGQINLGLKFAGSPEGLIRFTVSTILKDTKYGKTQERAVEQDIVKHVQEATPPGDYVTHEGEIPALPGENSDVDQEYGNSDEDGDTELVK